MILNASCIVLVPKKGNAHILIFKTYCSVGCVYVLASNVYVHFSWGLCLIVGFVLHFGRH